MLDDFLERAQSRGRGLFYGVTLGGGTLLLILTFWLWWHYFYLNPQNVFWNAVNNNLIVTGVTKHTQSQNDGEGLNQYEQISLGAHNFVKSQVIRSQEVPKSIIVTETLGTPQANFARYTKIQTDEKSPSGQPFEFNDVVDKWSKAELGTTTAQGSFTTAIFDVIPFAHFNAQQRRQVIGTMKDNDIYNIDFDKVAKERKDGRLYYTYDAAVTTGSYVALLKQVDSLMGLNQLKDLDPSQYQGGAPVKIKIKVDAVAQQLSSLTYESNNSEISYSGWGAIAQLQLPDKTISQDELQTKLNAALSKP